MRAHDLGCAFTPVIPMLIEPLRQAVRAMLAALKRGVCRRRRRVSWLAGENAAPLRQGGNTWLLRV